MKKPINRLIAVCIIAIFIGAFYATITKESFAGFALALALTLIYISITNFILAKKIAKNDLVVEATVIDCQKDNQLKDLYLVNCFFNYQDKRIETNFISQHQYHKDQPVTLFYNPNTGEAIEKYLIKKK